MSYCKIKMLLFTGKKNKFKLKYFQKKADFTDMKCYPKTQEYISEL